MEAVLDAVDVDERNQVARRIAAHHGQHLPGEAQGLRVGHPQYVILRQGSECRAGPGDGLDLAIRLDRAEVRLELTQGHVSPCAGDGDASGCAH